MSQIPSTPTHCPGFNEFKDLKSFTCECPECGAAREIFSDEFNRPQSCSRCGRPIDFSRCTLEGAARSSEPE